MRRITSRTLLVAPVLLLAAALGPPAGAAPHAPSPWSQGDYNGAQSRANLSETTLSPSTIRHVRYLRSITARPDAYCGSGIQAPVMSGGAVYEVETGSLTARTAATGKKRWAAPPYIPDTSDSFSTAVAHGVVLVSYTDCVSQSDPGSAVEAHSAATGRLLWRHSLDGYLSDLVVSGKYVVVEADDSSGGGSDAVSVMRVKDGSSVWTSSCAGGGHVIVVAKRVIYRCVPPDDDAAETIQASRLATGADAWSAPAGQILRGDSNTSSGRHLYVARSGVVDDVDPQTGATRFALDGADRVLAVDQTRVYTTCPDGVCAYGVVDGTRLWAASPPDTTSDTASAAEANGLVYLDSGDVIRASTGAFVRQLFQDSGKQVIVGDGRIGVFGGPSSRILDLYGLRGY